jgi:hypothetical protein
MARAYANLSKDDNELFFFSNIHEPSVHLSIKKIDKELELSPET